MKKLKKTVIKEAEEKRDENHNLKIIAKGAGIVFLGMIIGKIIGYFFVMFIARLGTEQYGLLTLGFAFVSFFTAIPLLGLDNGLLRYLPYYRSKRDLSNVKGAITSSLKICVPLSLFIAIIIFIFTDQIANYFFHNPQLAPILRIFSFIIPFSVITTLFSSTFRAFKRIEYVVGLKEILEKSIRLLAAFLLISFGLGIMGAAYSFLISEIFIFLVAILILEKKVFPIFRTKVKANHHIKELLDYSIPLMLSGIMVFMVAWADTLMLGYFKTASEVGIYNAAHPTAALMFILPTAIISLFLPVITELYTKKKTNEIKDIFKRVSRWIFFVSFPIFLMMLFFSKHIILIIFGNDYISAAPVLSILIFGYLFYSINYTSNNILNMAKKTKTIFFITLMFVGSNILLNFLLIPPYGVIGAAIATSASFIIVSILYIIFNFRLIKSYPVDKSFLKSILAGVLAMPVIYFLTQLIFDQVSIFRLVIIFFFFILFYLALLFLFKAFKKEDKELFKFIKYNLIRKK